MLNVYVCDLHNHTCASPCADPELTPDVLVAAAIDRGLDVIAVTDHNTAVNVEDVMRAASGTRLAVIPGIEITAQEEVHVIGLFATPEEALRFGAMLSIAGSPSPADPVPFGLADLTHMIHEHGGLAIASHIDRIMYGVLCRCGGVPECAVFDALEVSAACGIFRGRQRYPELAAFAMITSSDAHCTADIGRAPTRIRMAAPSIGELRQAFLCSAGRAVLE